MKLAFTVIIRFDLCAFELCTLHSCRRVRTKHKVPKTKNKFSGDFVDRVTPVPIPNTEVKPVGADGTARETAWESRKSPGLIRKNARSDHNERAFVFY